MYKAHGTRYVRKFPVNNGKTVYIRYVRYCVVHGEIDCFLFPDFDTQHGDCRNTPTQSAAVELPKVFAQAA